MADNDLTVAESGGGTKEIAGDEIGGIYYQRIKISVGADGAATDWPLGSGNQSGVPRVTWATDAPGILTTVAHDAVDAGDPLKIGMRALAHGTNPTAVAAADRTDWLASRAGIPWVIGGHPNVITESATIDDADGLQSDAPLVTVGAGAKIVVTMISATCSDSNTGNVAFRIGFGTATLPAASETGAVGILLEGKYAAGKGHQRGNGAGIVGVGADNEDLRITCDDPAGGSLFVTYSYYTIES